MHRDVAPLVAGGSIVMPHRFSVSQWWPLVDAHRPTWLNMVPTIIAYLLNGPELTADRRRRARNVASADRRRRRCRPSSTVRSRRASASRSSRRWDLTECASVASAIRSTAGAPIRIAGMPLGVEARVVDLAGRVLGAGERGEIECAATT
jgi:long-chain acyl-CoA synthetase